MLIIIMMIAILVLLVVAEIPYVMGRSHSVVGGPMTTSQYDYYHHTRNH